MSLITAVSTIVVLDVLVLVMLAFVMHTPFRISPDSGRRALVPLWLRAAGRVRVPFRLGRGPGQRVALVPSWFRAAGRG
jgi:hypothetical protein